MNDVQKWRITYFINNVLSERKGDQRNVIRVIKIIKTNLQIIKSFVLCEIFVRILNALILRKS